MGNVTALMMDVITEKSGHSMTGLAVSVCLTPAAPAPLPIPYPTMATVSEGVIDECMRTKIDGAKVLTVGSCTKNCHGNEPGTLKEVVSLNTAGPCFPILGAPIVFIELGMAGITLSPGFMNKNPVPGGGGSASGAGGGGGGGGGAGGGAGGPPGGSTQGSSNAGGGGGGSNSKAAPPSPPAPPGADGQASGGHPICAVTGALFTPPVQDFLLPGFFPVQWIRYYSSSAVRREVGLGFGWTCSLHWVVKLDRDGATLIDEAGREERLPPIADGEVAVLPYGRRVKRRGPDLVVEAGDGLERVLRGAEGESEMRLVELRDTLGHLTEIEHTDGQISALVDTVGRRAWAERHGRSLVWTVAVNDAAGQEHRRRLFTYDLDERGDLVRTVDAGGVVTEYSYDEDHFLVREKRPDGLVFVFRHEVGEGGKKRCVETWGEIPGRNVLAEMHLEGAAPPGVPGVYHTRLSFGSGLESKLTDAVGATQHYRGNAFGLVDVHIDPRGYQRLLRYDAVGHLVSVTQGARSTTKRTFDALGRLASQTDPSGAAARFTYDDEGHVVRADTAEGTSKIAWAKGLVKERTHEDGTSVKYAYDEHGHVVRADYSTGDFEEMAYDAHGNMTRQLCTNGQTWLMTYDLFGQPVRIEMPGGAVYELSYDSRGLLVTSKGPEGVLEYDNDGLGRVVTQRHSSGGLSRWRYVGDALVERTYPDGTRWRMGYDANCRLVAIENPLGERYQLTRDEEGEVVAERSFAGLVQRHERDGNGFFHRTLGPDESTVVARYELGEHGLTLRKQHSNGAEERFEYDKQLRLIRAKNSVAEVQRFYDEKTGRLEREVQIAGGHRFSFDYDADEHGRHRATRYSTGWSVGAERGPAGRLEKLTVRAGQREETLRIVFGDDGRERERTAQGSKLSVKTDRDSTGRPTRVAIGEEGQAPLRERKYAWSPEGPLSRIDDDRRGGRSYTLDAMGRPLRVSGLGADETFTYSALGIPMDRELGPGPVGRPRRAGNALLHWDHKGRLGMREGPDPASRWTYRYDENDRLIEAVRGDGLRVQYLYDALGRRLAETCGGISTWFMWEGWAIVEEARSTGDRVRRVFADDARTELLWARNDEPFRHVVSDATSTPWLFLGEGAEVGELDLSAWGSVAFENGDTDSLRFAGQRFDPITGLCYNRFRYYAPDLATFLTPDPGGLDFSMLDVAFVPNVTFYIDEFGLWAAIIRTEDDKVITSSTQRYTNSAPDGSKTFTHAEIDQAIKEGRNPLAGATNVTVVGHGAPGSIGWGPNRPIIGSKSINGQELGAKLKGAGFNGGPGTKVDVVSCNAGTKPFFGQSVSQGVATATGSPATGAVANNRVLGYLGFGGTTRTNGGSKSNPAFEKVDRGSIQPFSP